MAAALPLSSLHRFLSPATIRRIEPLENAGGWSGSLLWRVTVSGGFFCLRRWPKGTQIERLQLVHQFLTHVAARGIDFVPVPLQELGGSATVIAVDGHYWELTPWLPGIAGFRTHPSRQRLAAAMRALARLHVASEGLTGRESGARSQEPGASGRAAPAVVERLTLAEQLVAGELERFADACRGGLAAELDQRATPVLALARSELPPLIPQLQAAAQLALPLQPAIRDMHHDHVLFTGDAVTGIVDFGALRIDTPLVDIARLVGSLVRDDEAARDFALSAYSELRPLSIQDRQLIDLLDRSGVILGGLNWLRWLYVERRDMGPLPPIIQRLDEILARLSGGKDTSRA